MEKVVINPEDVRGLGDIVSPKQSSDFLRYGCMVTDGTDTTYGKIFNTVANGTGSYLTLSYPRCVVTGDTSFTLEAVLKNSSNSAITGATVYSMVNDKRESATTDSNGKVSFTIPVGSNPPGSYRIQCFYYGISGSVNGCFAVANVIVVDDLDNVDLDLMIEKPVIQIGEHDNLIARLHDGSRGVPGQTVYFYEEYEPTTLLLGSDKAIIQTGEQANLRATLKDSDGSGIEGETVYFYKVIEDLFNDNASVDRSSEYTNLKCENGNYATISFDTDKYLVNGSDKATIFKIDEVLPTNCVIQADVKSDSSHRIGVGITSGTGYADGFAVSDATLGSWRYTNSRWQNGYYTTEEFGGTYDGFLTVIVEKTGLNVDVTVKDGDATLCTMSKSLQFSASDTLYGGIIVGASAVDYFKNMEIVRSD